MTEGPSSTSGVVSRRTVLTSTFLGAVGVSQLTWAVPARAGTRERTADGWGAPVRGRDLFVDPVRGNDAWQGNLPAPTGRGNGPLATVEEATRRAYAKAAGLAEAKDRDFVHVWLRGGTYRRTEPWVVRPHGTPVQVRFLAYPGEQPVISGSQVITGWTPTTVNGVPAWKTTVPEARDGSWVFTQLYVDGRARPRPRLPKSVNRLLENGEPIPPDDPDFFYHFQPGTPTGPGMRTFVYRAGDIDPNWHDLGHVDVVAMDKWYDERSPIQSVDPTARTCTVAFRPYHPKEWGLRYYYVENVFEALTEPGEWYLDRRTGEVFYIPLPGETPDGVTISAPRVRHLLTVEGTSEEPVENVTFADLTFEHTSWDYWVQPPWQDGQSAANTVGAVVFREARNCTFTGCTIRFVGEYGLALEEGCQRLAVTHNDIGWTGSGGIKMASNRGYPGVAEARTGHNQITDNHIHHTGRVFHLGAGILARDTFGNTISHNHIHDLYYTGISVGWGWTFEDNPARDNVVEYNHIHDLSKGPLLSDLGGIYTLSSQPGTRVAYNYIHDIHANNYGAHGLYPDEGSSFMRFESNVVHDAETGLFLHFGAENVVRNNIFVRNRAAAVSVGNRERRGRGEVSLRVHHNILVTEGGQVFGTGYAFSLQDPGVASDNNLLWNTRGAIDDNGSLDIPAELKIVRASDGQDVAGATTTIVLSDGQPGTFVFGRLERPVTLAARTRYHILTQTMSGGSMWYNPVALQTSPGATLVGSTYLGTGGYLTASDRASFGPMNFTYTTPGDEQERTFVTGAELTSQLRNDYQGFLGMTIEVGDEEITVTSLGRLVPTATWWDLWRSTGRESNSLVADPKFVDLDGNDFDLAPDSPALRPPVSFQPVDLSDLGPRLRHAG